MKILQGMLLLVAWCCGVVLLFVMGICIFYMASCAIESPGVSLLGWLMFAHASIVSSILSVVMLSLLWKIIKTFF